MKNILMTLALLTLFGQTTWAQGWKISSESKVTFTIKNAGFTVDGSLGGLAGDIFVDLNALAKCKINVSIDANTINTGNNTRDGHLRKKEYFDVATYSKITFQVTQMAKSNKPGTYFAIGNLKIKDKIKEVQIPFTMKDDGKKVVLEGSFAINRLDYGVGSSSLILSNDVNVKLYVVLTK